MGVTTEEAKAKLSLDVSTLQPAKQSIENFGQSAHHSFLHAGSAARGFHKVLDQLKETAGPIGNLLQIAISPVAGTFIAAAAAIGFAHKQLEEFNKELDKMRDENVRPITTHTQEARLGIASRAGDLANTVRASNIRHRDEMILQGLGAVHAQVLSGMPPGPQRDAMERKFREAALTGMQRNFIGVQDARDAADRAANDPARQMAISNVKDYIGETERKLSTLNQQKGALQELAGHDVGIRERARREFGAAGEETMFPKEVEAEKKLKEIEKLSAELKKAKNHLHELNEEDKNATRIFAESQKAFDEQTKQIHDMRMEIDKLPPASPAIKSGTASMIDPVTGGIIYKPLPGSVQLGPTNNEFVGPPQLTPMNSIDENIRKLLVAAVESGLVLKLPE